MAKLPSRLDDLFNIREWDRGIVSQELIKFHIFPRIVDSNSVLRTLPTSSDAIVEGSFSGTAKAMTEVFRRIETKFQSYYDIAGFEPSLPLTRSLTEKTSLYTWKLPSPNSSNDYPPYLAYIPYEDQRGLAAIFDLIRLADTAFILSSVIPQSFKDFVYSYPDKGDTMEKLDQRNKSTREKKKDIQADPNVGDEKERKWYTDENFGQQSFTGVNPVTIRLAGDQWVREFEQEAERQGEKEVVRFLKENDGRLYVQNCSYIREAIGEPDIEVMSANSKLGRYQPAAVALYRLEPAGRLHPLAIVIDYKKTIDNSVTIFNTRLSSANTTIDQSSDWPWRYEKTCFSSSDWLRHEAGVHLTACHFIEEATIVGSHRTLPHDHLVYRVLSPHWLKTLPLNAAARETLVPSVVVPIVGLEADQVYSYVRYAYNTFDWVENYVPNDLKGRGFPLEELVLGKEKFHNYAYGAGIALIWQVLRKFVKAFLANGGKGFVTDDQVKNDTSIGDWCKEMQSARGAGIKNWPTIETVEQLVDCVTMCIHIASPQHTAVNYLQEYYCSYVPNRPPAICAPLPKTIQELKRYEEKDLMAALPLNRPNEWLLASHLVHLLSYKVAEDQNLVNYGVSLYHISTSEPAIREAAKQFVLDLAELGDTTDSKGNVTPGILTKISEQMDDQERPYKVMEPIATAVSILI